jgi:hypothetical protein
VCIYIYIYIELGNIIKKYLKYIAKTRYKTRGACVIYNG